MSDRYKKLYDLEHRLYASGAPVLIESGALLLDQNADNLLCQLCIRNIQSRPLKSLRAVVQMLDAEGAPLGKPVDHRYLALDLRREESLGREEAIVLPSRDARSFRVRLSQVTYADGEIWTDEDLSWEEVEEPLSLEEYLGGEELADAFRRRYGNDCRYAVLQAKELWFCTCGAANPQEENRCHACRRRRSALPQTGLGAVREEPSRWIAGLNSRKKAEGRGRVAWRKILPWGAGILALGALAAILLWPGQPDRPGTEDSQETETAAPAEDPEAAALAEAYLAAARLQDAGDYAAAADAFAALGGYKDSAALAEQARARAEQAERAARYAQAKTLLDEGSYLEARELFLALGDYEDSETLAREALYRKAVALYGFIETHKVKGITARLSDRADTDSLFSLSREKALEMGSQGLSELQDACGKDRISFVKPEDDAAELLPLEEAVAELFIRLGDYRDSAERAAALPEMMDRSDEFFALCAEGDLEGAREWLNAYTGDFEDRELWLQRIELYLPYCRSWTLFIGDPSLIPLIVDQPGPCYNLRSVVLLGRESATLRLLLGQEEIPGPELEAKLDETRFLLHVGKTTYLAEISAVGRFSVIKLNDAGTQGGVEYSGN
jgi:hypothetical protein